MDETPKSVWSGTFNVLGVELKCHVLDNGQRVIEEASMVAFLEAMAEQRPYDMPEAFDCFARWQAGLDVQ